MDTTNPTQIPKIHRDPTHPLDQWNAQFRSEREEERRKFVASGRAPGKRAVLTMVHNEAEFFPIWLRYYSQFFKPEDIYVLDHDTTDGSTAGEGFNRIPVSNSRTDWDWHVRTIENFQRQLFERYEVVLVGDVDEVVIPDPGLGDLGDYIDQFGESFVTCNGYEFIHIPALEPPLDLSRPITEQRSYWFHSPPYSKSLLTREPTEWKTGFHQRADGHMRVDPDLRLIHLHRVDYDICLARHRRLAEREWSKLDTKLNRANHNRLTETEEFDRWFFFETGFEGTTAPEGYTIPVEEVPEIWKGTI